MRVRPKTNSHKMLRIKIKYVCVCSVIQLFRKAGKAMSLQMEKIAGKCFKNSFGNGRKIGNGEDEPALLLLNSRSMWCTLERTLHGKLNYSQPWICE